MKKTTFFSLLTMLLLFVGNNVWADEPFYTLWTVSSEGTNHTNYNQYFDDEHDGMVWNAPGNQKVNETTTDRWRIGGKSLDKVDRTITAKTPMGSAINCVVLNHFGVSRNEVTVNSLTLTVASDVDYTTILDEVTLTPTIGRGEAGSVEFLPTSSYGTEWPISAYYRLTINISNSSSSNGGLDVASIMFYAPTGGVTVTKPTISPNGGSFTEPQEVTLTSEGNTIFYTTDGTDPTKESTQYTAPFTVNTSCTVKAIAYDADGNASSVASAEFKFLQLMTTIAEVCAAATSSREPALIQFNNWICTGVAGTNAYFTDGKNGILLYQSGHGFAQNDELSGTALVSLTLYNDCAELIGLTASTEGVTVTKGEGATPMTVIISDLEKNMQGNLITLEGVTYDANGKVFIDDDDNEIIPYNRFVNPLPELLDGKTYNVTGVAIWYRSAGKWEIAPRTADEFKLLTSQITPVSSWNVETEYVDINGTAQAVFTTTSDGAVTYASSDESVATINAQGVITPVSRGITTITAHVAETETYLPDSKSFILHVTENGYFDAIFSYSDEDIKGQGAPDTGAELTATRDDIITLLANKGYSTDSHIKVYGSHYETIDSVRTLTEPSFIHLTARTGYSIFQVVITATDANYIKEWTDQFGNAAVIDGATATWEGDSDVVILTNQASGQARVKTIAVTYVDTEIVDAIASPIERTEGNGAIYNLAGQRLSKMQKGINIVGGKKILK